MIVPRYWAQARLQEKRPGRQITLFRFGWSSESPEDAQRMAEARVREAMARALAGERTAQRDHKIAYNGAEGLPIREEIVAEYGATIITRDAYGAWCLNSPDVLIADIDFEEPKPDWFSKVGCLAVAVPLVAGLVFGKAVGLGLLAAVGVFAAVRVLRRTWQAARVELEGGVEQIALRRIHAFCAKRPAWRVHVYRTPAGLRALATHRRFDPLEPDVNAFFQALKVDPVYVWMSSRQRCFRARLSAKPWRIGIATHLRPRPGVWPVKPERLPERRAWLDAYDARAAGFAACRALEVVGQGTAEPEAEAVRLLHDELSGASSGRPLA